MYSKTQEKASISIPFTLTEMVIESKCMYIILEHVIFDLWNIKGEKIQILGKVLRDLDYSGVKLMRLHCKTKLTRRHCVEEPLHEYS